MEECCRTKEDEVRFTVFEENVSWQKSPTQCQGAESGDLKMDTY